MELYLIQVCGRCTQNEARIFEAAQCASSKGTCLCRRTIMSDYITTYTGKHFEPANPDPEMIQIEDIAHALSLICRGNGHVKSFWSVGQHCISCAKEACARGLSTRIALACLLHDASECYMSDIPRPFKKGLPDYRAREERLLDTIYRKFTGSSLTPV